MERLGHEFLGLDRVAHQTPGVSVQSRAELRVEAGQGTLIPDPWAAFNRDRLCAHISLFLKTQLFRSRYGLGIIRREVRRGQWPPSSVPGQLPARSVNKAITVSNKRVLAS